MSERGERVYLKAAELAERFGVSVKTIHRWRRHQPRPLHSIRPGRDYLFHREVVARWEEGLRLVPQDVGV
ncbi:MAG: helix-turn-helix domain-containing protein [Desulfobulbaceae bacterium]|nr:helix-turn-helix domain-containing protein [Desulfobulbaceae bacterium]